MPVPLRPIRRVVTGQDAEGRSTVLYDSAAPNVSHGLNAVAKSGAMTDVWVYTGCPVNVKGTRDDGNDPFSFDPPADGGHLRIVHSAEKPADYDRSKDASYKPIREPFLRGNGHTWDRGGNDAFSSPIHKSTTIDWAVVLEGKRTLLLDSGPLPMEKGDTVVQIANWHGWTNPDEHSLMAFVMIGSEDDGRGGKRE
jgi:hypothetical protein